MKTLVYFVKSQADNSRTGVGLTRIWEKGKLVYDMRPRQDGESDVDYSNRLTASSKINQFELSI